MDDRYSLNFSSSNLFANDNMHWYFITESLSGHRLLNVDKNEFWNGMISSHNLYRGIDCLL